MYTVTVTCRTTHRVMCAHTTDAPMPVAYALRTTYAYDAYAIAVIHP